MNTLLSKTVGIAIASASLLISTQTFAAPKPTIKNTTPATHTTSVGTIVQVASANSSLKTLVAAINAAGLVDTLSGKGPFTVFAPTDKAFAALPKGTLEKLLKPENKGTLAKILTYHVVSSKVTSKTIKSGNVKTVQGSSVKIQVKKGLVSVGNSKVITADIKASNGVIHLIDKVLIPSDVKL